MTPQTASETVIEVDGECIDLIDADTELAERTIEIRCASGNRSTATWGGVPLRVVLERVPIPLETTHLLVVSSDGYQCCIDVGTALNGLLAVGRNGVALEEASGPRFVSSSVDGIRTVKDVSKIETVSLASNENPNEFEELEGDLDASPERRQ